MEMAQITALIGAAASLLCTLVVGALTYFVKQTLNDFRKADERNAQKLVEVDERHAANYKELNYEGYAPGGVAVILDVVTDNLNRTASEVRHLFDKHGGQLGASGCVSWMFDFKGVIELEIPEGKDEDDIMMMALDAGAEDVTVDEGIATVYTDPGEFSQVREALEKDGLTFLSADRTMLPKNTVEITDPEMVAKVRKLLEVMEDDDDVQEVYHNAILPEEDDEEE